MIITVTPNPAVDQTMFVDGFEPVGVNRAWDTHLDPAGKGINGFPCRPPAGLAHHCVRVPRRRDGTHRGGRPGCRGRPATLHPCAGPNPVNMTVVAGPGEATSVYGPGPLVDAEHVDALTDVLDFWLQAGRALVLAGSLPPGIVPRLVRRSGAAWTGAGGDHDSGRSRPEPADRS